MLKTPTKSTLSRYGLTEKEWKKMADEQEHKCYVCLKAPSSERLNIDHYHVRGWKKMPPEQRKLYVRGLLCFFCNRYYLSRSISIPKALRVVEYLKRFELIKPKKT